MNIVWVRFWSGVLVGLENGKFNFNFNFDFKLV